MDVLITGASGFVGRYLAQQIKQNNPSVEIYGTDLHSRDEIDSAFVEIKKLDLKQENEVVEFIERIQPDYIYHLAAQAFVPRSFEAPWETLENNIKAQLNITQACLKLNIQPRMLVISSAEVYGAVHPDDLPVGENTPLKPSNPYSVSKVTQDMLALQFHLSHKLPILRARPFNHIGPGQNGRFVVPAFALQIAKIEQGLQEPIISVGNLKAKRDFTDVRDIVRAYQLIAEEGNAGDVYNVASGKAHSIESVLDTLLSFSEADIEVQIDQSRLRPVDVPIVEGDSKRLFEATGWQPIYSFEQTLHDVLDDCRQRVRSDIKEN